MPHAMTRCLRSDHWTTTLAFITVFSWFELGKKSLSESKYIYLRYFLQKTNLTTSTLESELHLTLRIKQISSQPPTMCVGTRILQYQLEKPGFSPVRKRLPAASSQYIPNHQNSNLKPLRSTSDKQ